MVRIGFLKKFIEDALKRQRSSDTRNEHPKDSKKTYKDVSRVINRIIGGEWTPGGKKKRQRKDKCMVGTSSSMLTIIIGWKTDFMLNSLIIMHSKLTLISRIT